MSPRTIVQSSGENFFLKIDKISLFLREIFFIISKLVAARSRHCDVTRGSYFTEPFNINKGGTKNNLAKINFATNEITN